MRLKSLVAAFLSIAAMSCVDKDFQLDKVSTEVAIGGQVTTIPLGYLEKQRLGDIIDLDSANGLTIDKDGNYSLTFDGEESEITIEGVENRFNIAKTMTSFSTEYPAFDITGTSCRIDHPYDIIPNFGGLNIPYGVAIPVPGGHTILAKEEGMVTEILEYEVPKYLAAIKRIYLKPQKPGDKGAAIHLMLDLNDLAAVNGGGHITLELIANDGYELYDHNGNALKEIDHQGHTTTYHIANEYMFAAGAETVEFTIYIASIANESQVVNNKLTIPIEFGYHLSFDITSRANTIVFNKEPELHVDTTLQYQDADIVLNEVMLLEHGSLANSSTSITINNLPKEVKSVKRVSFSEHSPMHLLAEGLDWLDDNIADNIIIEAQLPEYLTLHDEKQRGYDAETHTLRTSLNDLRHTIDINLDALVFSGEGLVPHNGSITLDFTPDIAAYIKGGTEVKLSKILHEKEIEFSAGFDDTTLELVSVEGQVAYQYDEHVTIDLGDFDKDINLNIGNIGLSPVLTLTLYNPLTIDANVSAKLTPIVNDNEISENSIVIDNLNIKAASMVGGELQRGATTLIIANESLRESYSGSNYNFIACDLGKILTGSFPDKIKMDFNLSTDENATHTIYIANSYTVGYDYSINVPLSFENNFDLSIEKLVDNLSDTFAAVSEYDIALEDVAIIADIKSTIPLDLEFDAQALNTNGKPSSVTLNCDKANNTIKGSADGVSEVESTLRLEIGFGKNGNIRQLADIEAILFKLNAKRTESGIAKLNTEQYFSLSLKMEISGQINVDLGNF